VAKPKNLDDRNARQCDPLRMRTPVVAAAQHRTAHPALRERIFKRLRIPRRDRLSDLRRVVAAFQQCKRALARAEAAMQMNPAAIARAIERGCGLRAPIERRRLAPLVGE